jgi:hypothetical protein
LEYALEALAITEYWCDISQCAELPQHVKESAKQSVEQAENGIKSLRETRAHLAVPEPSVKIGFRKGAEHGTSTGDERYKRIKRLFAAYFKNNARDLRSWIEGQL